MLLFKQSIINQPHNMVWGYFCFCLACFCEMAEGFQMISELSVKLVQQVLRFLLCRQNAIETLFFFFSSDLSGASNPCLGKDL